MTCWDFMSKMSKRKFPVTSKCLVIIDTRTPEQKSHLVRYWLCDATFNLCWLPFHQGVHFYWIPPFFVTYTVLWIWTSLNMWFALTCITPASCISGGDETKRCNWAPEAEEDHDACGERREPKVCVRSLSLWVWKGWTDMLNALKSVILDHWKDFLTHPTERTVATCFWNNTMNHRKGNEAKKLCLLYHLRWGSLYTILYRLSFWLLSSTMLGCTTQPPAACTQCDLTSKKTKITSCINESSCTRKSNSNPTDSKLTLAF